ncbi:hypothetical protein [Proteiniborus sp. MB09-C3]|uniref:hypothetical protein n=1 Tax=Proteiniborus sp. MB09-C3 TaxID=3050072 RepID=UPI002552C96D|nr:hypothetical protein [Proteiniborus sp. MB09-C3]WIV10557.1 hypothetical protein QO263_10335 [Proteiniborus sp. MB09-C3]
MINLKEIKKNELGQIQECFTTNNPRIKSVIFTYAGREKDMDNFLQSLILEYGKNEKLIA